MGFIIKDAIFTKVTAEFSVAVTVMMCKPTVAGLLVQIDIRPLKELIVNSAVVSLATPLSDILEIAK